MVICIIYIQPLHLLCTNELTWKGAFFNLCNVIAHFIITTKPNQMQFSQYVEK